jgi:hypothetical protein
MKNAKNYLVKGVVGMIAGTAVGTLLIPMDLVSHTLAPITYPIQGGFLGYHVGGKEPKGTGIGMILGAAMIPMAPALFLLTPILRPLSAGALGLMAGVGLASSEEKARDKQAG